MDYIFGTNGTRKVLKTKGSEHTNLTGYHEIERVYPDQTITDSFKIVKKLDSKEDVEGNCYDWYEITEHYRFSDKTKPVKEALEQTKTELEDALLESDTVAEERFTQIEDAMLENDTTTDERITSLEDAILEIDEQLNGGTDNG